MSAIATFYDEPSLALMAFLISAFKPTSLPNSSLTNTRQWNIRQGLFCWIFNLNVPLFWEPNGNWIIWCPTASLGYFESLLCRGVVAKSLRCGSGPSFHLSWCESGSVHDPHKSSSCPCWAFTTICCPPWSLPIWNINREKDHTLFFWSTKYFEPVTD